VALAALLFLALAAPPVRPSPSADASGADLVAQAEAAFRAGVERRDDPAAAREHFRAAAARFEELRRRGAPNAALFLDLGNAYLLADDLPRAVLSYRRGLRLAPGDAGLEAALERARALAGSPPDAAPGRPAAAALSAWAERVPAAWAFRGAVGLYALACAGVTRWRMTRRGRALGLGLLALAGAAGLAVPVALAARRAQFEAAHPLVVIAADGVPLRRGDALTYPPRYPAPANRGAEGRLLARRGAWLQAELASGEVGWIPRDCGLVDEEGGP
jgi:hypothetical protein